MRSSLQSPVQRCIAASNLSVLLSSHSLQADDLLHSFPDAAAAHHIQFLHTGIPGYKDLATKAAPYGKNIIGNQELQREAIYRERIIEMLGEGNYYFDMHRWMRAGWSQDETTGKWIKDNEDKLLIRYGMDIDKASVKTYNSAKNTGIEFYDKIGEGSFYNRIVVDRYPWSKAMLLYPVPYNEMQKSELTVQNPLWN